MDLFRLRSREVNESVRIKSKVGRKLQQMQIIHATHLHDEKQIRKKFDLEAEKKGEIKA
jgi:hypothetical protein